MYFTAPRQFASAPFLFGLLLVLSPARAATPTVEASAVRAARLAQNSAIAARNLEIIASFWTDDVIIQRGLGTQCVGKPAYLALYRDDGPNALVYERIPDAIEVSNDWPLAFETGRWEGRDAGRTVIKGRYSAQWVKRGDRWLIRGEVFVALEAVAEGKQLKAVP